MSQVQNQKTSEYFTRKGFTSSTVPGLFLERCTKTPNKIALRVKELGIYQDITWQQYYERAENFGLGLLELGLQPGDRAAIMSDSCPEWLYADIAVQCVGGVSYGIYPTSSVPETEYLMTKGGAKFFIAQDQEFVDKILPVVTKLPNLKNIIVVDTQLMFLYRDPHIISFKEVEELGKKRKTQEPGLFMEMISRVKNEDIATIIWTSGTTGFPKGAMISQNNIVNSYIRLVDSAGTYFHDSDREVAYMPLAHGFARTFDEYIPIVAGYQVYFGEDVTLMQETLFEVSPTIMMCAPRTLEKMASQVLVGIDSSIWVKRMAYKMAMWLGKRSLERKWNTDARLPLHWAIAGQVARHLAFRQILDKLGMMRLSFVVVGGAAVSAPVVALWQVWGVPIRELYGGTEFSLASCQLDKWPKPGNAGKILPWCDYKLEETGEFVIRSTGVFQGYWQDDALTKEVKVGEWLHTGDVIKVENERLKIVDRLKDIVKTAGGKALTPSEIERAIKASPYISDAVVFAEGRKFPSALIEINFDSVSEWARNHGILYTSFTSLTEHPKVTKLIDDEVRKANTILARVEQVKKFRIIPQELNPEDAQDPVTPTRKVKRKKIYERFRDLVESMYEADEEKSRIGSEVSDIAGIEDRSVGKKTV